MAPSHVIFGSTILLCIWEKEKQTGPLFQNPFLMGKKKDQCGNITYRLAYDFFEKKRILEGEPTSARRSKHEAECPGGFSLIKERAGKNMYMLDPSAGWAFSF
jgi:hypothetical protein